MKKASCLKITSIFLTSIIFAGLIQDKAFSDRGHTHGPFLDTNEINNGNGSRCYGRYPIMFGERRLNGRRVEIRRSYSNLRDLGFNDAAGSYCVPPNYMLLPYLRAEYYTPPENRSQLITDWMYHHITEGHQQWVSINFWKSSGYNNKVTSVRVYYCPDTNLDNCWLVE